MPMEIKSVKRPGSNMLLVEDNLHIAEKFYAFSVVKGPTRPPHSCCGSTAYPEIHSHDGIQGVLFSLCPESNQVMLTPCLICSTHTHAHTLSDSPHPPPPPLLPRGASSLPLQSSQYQNATRRLTNIFVSPRTPGD